MRRTIPLLLACLALPPAVSAQTTPLSVEVPHSGVIAHPAVQSSAAPNLFPTVSHWSDGPLDLDGSPRGGDLPAGPRFGEGTRAGALWGLYLGTAVGLISGALAAPHVGMETWVAVATFGGGGALTGTLTGAALGSMIGGRRPPNGPRAGAGAPEP
jgi:hypothetical protein